ncbi:hypothetical protein ABK040_006913 [Willaertia magna]
MFSKQKRKNYHFSLPNEIICHILSYLTVPEDYSLKYFINSINNLYLINKQFNECVKNLFDNTFYKDLLFSTYLKYVTIELQQKIIEIYNYKTIYSFLNNYLKIKQLNSLKPLNNLYYNKYSDFFEIKVAVMGEGGVGKSSITRRFIQDVFVVDYEPRIEDAYRKYLNVDNKKYLVDVLDTPGQEEFVALKDHYCRSSDCLITVCDLTNRRTLDEVEYNIERFYRIKDQDNLPIVIVGNKLDLIEEENSTREVTKEMIDESIQKSCGCGNIKKPIYIETSAKTGFNIEEVFSQACRMTQSNNVDWNDVIKRWLTGENIFKEFEKSQKCIVM